MVDTLKKITYIQAEKYIVIYMRSDIGDNGSVFYIGFCKFRLSNVAL